METIVKKIPVTETKQVKTGEKEITIYITKDGKKFSTADEYNGRKTALQLATEHEERLDIVTEGYKSGLFKPVDINEALANLIFDAWGDLSEIVCHRVGLSNNPIDFYTKFLRAAGNSANEHTVNSLLNDVGSFFICSYTIDESSDYPRYETKYLSVDAVNKKIEDIKKQLEEIVK